MQRLVVRYNKLVKHTRRSQRRLLADIHKLQSTGGTSAVTTQPTGYVAPSAPSGVTAPGACSRRRAGSGRRAGTHPTRHPHQLMSATTSTTTEAWEWRATGTTWRVLHTGGVSAALAAAISQAVERDEARWSRFRRDSEVSRMNRAGGRPVPISAETLDLLEAGIAWTRRTDGVFQPLIGDTLVAWGYRRSLLESKAYAAGRPGRAATRRSHRPEP